MIVDTHAHLDDEKLVAQNIIDSMKSDNIKLIISVGTDVATSEKNVEIAKTSKNVYALVGIHPEFVDNVTAEDFAKIENLASDENVVGVGEIGLDYHYEDFDKEKQKWVFVEMLKIAHKLKLPVCLHIRDAFGDAMEILRVNKNLLSDGGVAHCFSGSAEIMKELAKMGFYFSFGGIITYKNYSTETLSSVPLNLVLTETDCPYLSPVPLRGTINEPKNINFVLDKMSDVFGVGRNELEKQIELNSKNLFKKIKD